MSDVNDELDGSPILEEVLGDALGKLKVFHVKLAAEGEPRGLIGPRDVGIIWERHILNSAAIVPFIREATAKRQFKTVADIGSGGGFPGIVAAACLPDHQFTLVEPMERRIEWLHECVDEMGLDNVSIVRSRANAVIEAVRGSNGGPEGQGRGCRRSRRESHPGQASVCRGDLPCGRADDQTIRMDAAVAGQRRTAGCPERTIRAGGNRQGHQRDLQKRRYPSPRGGGRGWSGSGTDACADGGQAISYPQNRVSYPQYPQSRKCVTKHLEEAWNCNDCSVDNFWEVG